MIVRADQNNQIQPGDLVQRATLDGDGMLSPTELAACWNVHPDTIYRDIRKGALPAFRLPGGQIRIRKTDARKYGRPIE